MKIGSRRTFLGATAIAVACLLGAATGQARPAQDAQETPTMAEDAFESVALLRGIPVDTFLEAMGMFANAMGNDCTYCHASSAPLDRSAFAVATPRLQRARQMIVMMNAINKTYFGGAPRVTCFTCHGGNQSPRSDPNLALQYSTPVEDPNVRDFPHRSDDLRGSSLRSVSPGARWHRTPEWDLQLRRRGNLRRIRYLVCDGPC